MPNLILRSLTLFLIIFTMAQMSMAIIIRHDRDDAKYLALGAKYPAVGYFQERVGCTLIAPQWALTAAHTVESNPAFIHYYVMFGDTRYEVEKIILHPARVTGTVDSSADMALLKLKKPVRGIKPVMLYEKTDEPEKEVILVGNGATGNGLSGPTGDRGKLRGATNQIEAALENSLLIVFDAPPLGTELEGVGGAGDSGTPALYEENGTVYIVGVGSFNSGDRKRGNVGKYGTFDGYARVSTRRDWILDTIKTDPPDSLWGETTKIGNGFPNDIFGRRADAFFKAFNSGRESAIADFYAEHRPPSPEGKTPQERAKGWQAIIDQYGKYEPRGFSKKGAHNYSFLVFATSEKIWRGVEFEFEKTAPHRIKSIGMWDAEPPKDSGKP